MRISQLYDEYMVPKNLQEHMLRVGALAKIITENWKGEEVDKKAIVQACVFHDIAKPMTFDLAKQAQFGMTPEDIKKLGVLQEHLKSKFGTDEHRATVEICKEIGLGQTSVRLVDNLEWKYIPRLLEQNDFAALIPIYCDMRIGPNGIVTLDKRLNELKMRTNFGGFDAKNASSLEELIKTKVNIDVDLVTDEQINQLAENLLNSEL